jgi:hypothetical protein
MALTFRRKTPPVTFKFPSPAPEILKFEREDWALFRTVDGLQQKAGVPKEKLRRLVLKELADNALDESGQVLLGELDDGGYFIEDHGRGIDGTPEDVARLFSIARPLVSTKLLRLPIRGALGNGLRVVAGAVLASEGTLTVTTRNRRISLRPERDGTITVISAALVDFPVGTRIEVHFGAALPHDDGALKWANWAAHMAQGTEYAGKSSPFWYDLGQWQEVLYAAGPRPVRELIATLDGCTGGKAGEIVAAANLSRAICKDVTGEQAARLLTATRNAARPVKPDRLGSVGQNVFPEAAYTLSSGVIEFGSTQPLAQVPVVVEIWMGLCRQSYLNVCINRTPITGDVRVVRQKRDINVFGCGLRHTVATAPVASQFDIVINITTPYMPITSDGKEPNLRPFLDLITTAVKKAVRKAHRPKAGGRTSQKDVVLDHLDEVVADVSGDGEYRFGERQVLYRIRKIVFDEIGETLTTGNFKAIVTDYEAEHGDIPGMYREARGTLYHPHLCETKTLGTLMVEEYERPIWTYNKLVYIEKEGFSEALKEVRWAERHDCGLASSKGFTTRAVRDLVDKLAEHDEPVTIFCVHDADAWGTMIYQTFQDETKARGARKIKIINLGLEPWDAVAAGFDVEDVKQGDKRKPVADYVLNRPDGDYWEEWLQTHRIDLNAMTTPEFIAWLDQKIAPYHEKLIPPLTAIEAKFNACLEAKLRERITERILREANVDAQVAAALARFTKPDPAILAEGIKNLFRREPDSWWRDHIEEVVSEWPE